MSLAEAAEESKHQDSGFEDSVKIFEAHQVVVVEEEEEEEEEQEEQETAESFEDVSSSAVWK